MSKKKIERPQAIDLQGPTVPAVSTVAFKLQSEKVLTYLNSLVDPTMQQGYGHLPDQPDQPTTTRSNPTSSTTDDNKEVIHYAI